jgi:N-acetylneuraminic acid mutarotase
MRQLAQFLPHHGITTSLWEGPASRSPASRGDVMSGRFGRADRPILRRRAPTGSPVGARERRQPRLLRSAGPIAALYSITVLAGCQGPPEEVIYVTPRPATQATPRDAASRETTVPTALPTNVPATNTPATVASMATPVPQAPHWVLSRQTPAISALTDGRILVTGGRQDDRPLAAADLYDPSTNGVGTTAPLSTARYNHSATMLPEGKVLVVGGQSTETGFVATAEIYDPIADRWSSAGALATARAGHTATLMPGGQILVAGGHNSRRFLETVELYDPVANAWTTAPPMNSARSGHTATLLPGGLLLVAGGFGGKSQAGAERYNPADNTWTTAGSLADGRFGHTATPLPDGKVLVAGGLNSAHGGTYLASVETYDPVANGWAGAPAMGGARAFHTATPLLDGEILVLGGKDGRRLLASAERYDPAKNGWTSAGSLRIARWLHTATLLSGRRVLVVGGMTEAGPSTSPELHDTANGSMVAY